MTVKSCASLNALLLATMIAAPLAAGFAVRAEDAAQPAAAPAAAAPAAAANPSTEVWIQFAHYTLIARPDLAAKAADALNGADVSDDQLLGAIEASNTRYQDVEKILSSAVQLDGLKTQAAALANKIQAARIAHAQDSARILADIERLGDGSRAYTLAVQRLKASGQYAAPLYISTLQDQTKSRLHPHVLTAMVEVGDPLAYPLSVALPHLDTTTAERVADVLSKIRHPVALPYLKMAMEDQQIRQVTRDVFAAVYKDIATRTALPQSAPATTLFTHLGETVYQAGTVNAANPLATMSGTIVAGKGLTWQYVQGAGLTPITIPGIVLADHLAMQMAETALSLDPHNAAALNLHLASNLRRENRLKGQADAAYPATRQPPAIHLLLAGPDQQQGVLLRALDARDADLALNAIDALGKTVDDYNFEGTRQPLIDCLTYGDARVRYSAALALGNASPKTEFPGSSSVVPILGQILRASSEPNALVVAAPEGNDSQVGIVTAALEKAGFKQAVGGRTLAEAKTVGMPVLPSIELIAYQGSLQGFNNLMAGVHANGLYRTVPVLALVDAQTATAIKVAYPNDPRITTADVSLLKTPEDLGKATKLAISAYRGDGMDAKGVDGYAAQALAELLDIAATPSVYSAVDARLSLESALNDTRPFVAIGAARVLEKFNRADSQNALLKAAMGNSGDVQEAQLNSAAKSFEAFGNKADPELFKQLVEFFKATPSAAAARAVGAGRPSPDLAVGAILPKADK